MLQCFVGILAINNLAIPLHPLIGDLVYFNFFYSLIIIIMEVCKVARKSMTNNSYEKTKYIFEGTY